MAHAASRSVDMLVVSSASHTAINRAVYRLFASSGVSTVIVAPTELSFRSKVVPSQPPRPDDPPLEYLRLRGEHPRSWRFENLKGVLDRYRPKLVLLDNDPGSVLALEIGLWAARTRSRFCCITCENLPVGLLAAVRRRGLTHLPAAVAKRAVMAVTKRLIHGLFTISNEGTELSVAEGFKRVRRIPLGFDPEYFKIDPVAGAAVRDGLGLTGFVVGFFGRLSYEKGIHVLIEALARLADHDWIFVMDRFDTYANPYGEEVRRQLVGHGILERVVFINPTHAEMGAYLNAVDVVVMPSVTTPTWIEQYGRVAPEAMACGKVVVASRVGALPLLIGDHGILFPEGDVAQLATILGDMMRRGEAVEGHLARERISAYAHDTLSIASQVRAMRRAFDEA